MSRIAGLLTFCALLTVQSVSAQLGRPSNSLFVRPSFGFVNYLGDNNNNLLELGVKGQLEVGYQISPALGISALYNYGEYTEVLRPDVNTGLDRSTGNTRLSNAQVLVRYTLGAQLWEVAPYIHGGAGVAFGGDQPADEPGWGPVFGAGLDIMISPNVSFFFEGTSNFSLPDDAIDGPDRGLFADHDLLMRYSLGLNISFGGTRNRRFVPVEINRINAPTTLEVDEVGTFEARGNMGRASEPVSYQWDFGDGEVSPVLNATHSFSRPGTYTVTFQMDNDESSDFETHTVIVTPRDAAPVIVAMNNNPADPDTRTMVNFDANVMGSDPLDYLWEFEDGEISRAPFPSRVFDKEGVHEVQLTVTNSLGNDSQTILVTVHPFEAGRCDETVSLNRAYFGHHSSVLTEDARIRLDENLDILTECPNMTVRVDAFAVPGERNAVALADDRARAVEAYYIRNGVAQSRILAMGRGEVAVSVKKDGGALYRRADTTITGQ